MKLFAILLLVFGVSGLAWAEGVSFTISSTALPPIPEDHTQVTQNGLIARLKHQAVVDYLQRQMGTRYAQVESQVTPEFTERFVLDYSVAKKGRTDIDLSGHLDADALKRWVRVTEAKGGGGMKPLFVLSSQLPEMPISARETPAKIHEGALGPALYAMLGAVFQKFSAKLSTLNGEPGIQFPPRRDVEFRALRDFAQPNGYNCAVWVHLSPCKGCGTKVDFYFINLPQGRMVVARTDDVPFEAKDFSSTDRVRKELKEPLRGFSSEFEELVSAGIVFSSAYRVAIEGIDSYRTFRTIDSSFSKLDFVNQVLLKRSEPQLAEFQLLSSLGPDELYSRLQLGNFPGFSLKPVRNDGTNMVLRYSK